MNLCHQEGTKIWQFTEPSDVAYQRALDMLSQNDTQGAMLLFQEVVERDPTFLPAMMMLGIVEYQAACACEGKRRKCLLVSAEAHLIAFVTHELKRVVAVTRPATPEEYGEGYYFLALIILENPNLELIAEGIPAKEAVWYFMCAIQRRPAFFASYLPVAQWYFAEGNIPEACKYAERYLFYTRKQSKEYAKERETMRKIIACKGLHLVRG